MLIEAKYFFEGTWKLLGVWFRQQCSIDQESEGPCATPGHKQNALEGYVVLITAQTNKQEARSLCIH